MSGISGIFLRDGSYIDSLLIKDINNYLSHRGPNGSGIWLNKSIALGHQMLHTTQESLQEKLPFHDKETGNVITADARIDNRKELAPLLKIENSIKIPDSIFILESYQKWGENCPEKLLGDFAFVVWDPKKEQLFCARDQIGIKPFYYYSSDYIFAFASEIKPILKIPGIPIKFNEKRVAQHLLGEFEDREITFYEEVWRLPAAHKLTVNNNNFKLEKYWELDPTKKIILKSDSEYAEMFLKIFKEAVRCRLRSAYPIGSTLSGGIDSSSIVCTAREILLNDGSYPLKTFSLIFEETPEADERYYINFILEKGFLDPYSINVDEYSPTLNLDPFLWHNDGPFFAHNLYYNYLLYKIARNEDVRILLDGSGGDTTISHGKGVITDLFRKNHYKKCFDEIKNTAANRDVRFYSILFLELIKVYPKEIEKLLKILPVKVFSDIKLIKKEFEQKTNLCKKKPDLKETPKISDKSIEYHYHSLNSGFTQYALEHDRIAAPFNIEVRYPFYDVRLIEFCLAIPPEQKRQHGWTRYIIRRSMQNILPLEIQWRNNKKTGAKSVMRNFLNKDKVYIENLIYNDYQIIEKYVDIKNLHKLYDNLKKNQFSPDLINMWFAISLGLWLQKNDLNKL